jgi:hypothetical protein
MLAQLGQTGPLCSGAAVRQAPRVKSGMLRDTAFVQVYYALATISGGSGWGDYSKN